MLHNGRNLLGHTRNIQRVPLGMNEFGGHEQDETPPKCMNTLGLKH